jgi:gas vesicle protein
MPKKTLKPKHPRINPADEVITRDKLEPFFENIKDLIISTAKGTETVLRKDIRRVESELHLTQVALKTTKDDLRSEIKATKDELRTEIKDTETRLRTEIKDAETRLSDKIDRIHVSHDDHEDRITALEGVHT